MNQQKITYKKLNTEELIKESKKATKRMGMPSLMSCNMCFNVIHNEGVLLLKLIKRILQKRELIVTGVLKK